MFQVTSLAITGLVVATALRRPGVWSRPRSSLSADSALLGSEDREQAVQTSSAAERIFREAASAEAGQADDGLSGLRARGRDLLGGLRWPSGRDEAWRFTNMRTLFEPEYRLTERKGELSPADLEPFVEPACVNSLLVIVDGEFREDLSRPPASLSVTSARALGDEAVALTPELEALPDAGEKPRDSFGSDSLVALGMAAASDVLTVEVPLGLRAPPLQLIVCSTRSGDPTACHPRVAVVAGQGSSLQLKQSVLSWGDQPALLNSFTRLVLREGAEVTHSYAQETGAEVRALEVLAVDVAEDANYKLTALQVGGRLGRINAHVNLNAPNANCTMKGVTLAQARQSLDLHSSISHRAPSTTSRQYQRNVVGDRGEAIFKGRIRIPEVAMLADSDQLCRTLMLGDRARVVAMPTLEISADDITCSHGAAVCDLDENALFYLGSRGVNRLEARKLLMRSFVLEMLDEGLMGPAALERLLKKLESLNPEQDLLGSSRRFESL